MVKYRTPDGKEGYASPDRVPPGATVEVRDYQPDGSLTRDWSKKRVLEAKPSPITSAREAPLGASTTADERRAALARERWQRKGEGARNKLAKAEREHERWRVRCHGAEDRGSLQEVPPGCSNYERGQLEAASAVLEEAREWAEDGLYDACRRDDHCLPGYIR